jgi:hypothetical protein
MKIMDCCYLIFKYVKSVLSKNQSTKLRNQDESVPGIHTGANENNIGGQLRSVLFGNSATSKTIVSILLETRKNLTG